MKAKTPGQNRLEQNKDYRWQKTFKPFIWSGMRKMVMRYTPVFIQNSPGSAALNLTCSNNLLYDPACETVKRKAVN